MKAKIKYILHEISECEYRLSELKDKLEENSNNIHITIQKILDKKISVYETHVSNPNPSDCYKINCFKNNRSEIQIELYVEVLYEFELIKELSEMIGVYPKINPIMSDMRRKSGLELVFNYYTGTDC